MMVFKQIGTDADSYTKRLTFLSKSFSDIHKDLKNGLGFRKGLFSVITEKDVKSLQDFNKAINNGTKYADAFDTHMSKAPIAVKRQANEIIKLHIQQKQLNQQLQKGRITQNEYNTAMSANKAQVKALTTQTKNLADAQRTSTFTTKAMSIALNLLGNIAIVTAISVIITGIDKFVKRVEITKEKVEELISTSKSALDTANSNAKRVEELADKYDKLSDGVNNLGENVSLTNEEYEEYNSLVDDIADMFPTLIKGYTDEGNAIIDLKGNVNELRDAYREAQQEAYNLLIVGGKDSDGNDILKQWKNLGHTKTKNGATTLDAIKQLEAIINMSAERFRYIEKTFSSGSHDEILALSDIEKEIVSKGFIYKTLGISGSVSDEDYAKARTEAKALLQTYKSEVDSALSDVESLANAYLMTNDDYAKLDEQSKKAASIIVNSLDEDIVSGFNKKTDVAKYVNDLVQTILSNETARNALNSLFTLDMKNTSVGEIKSNVEKYINIIAQAIGEDSDKLKIRLGFDDVDDTLQRAKTKFTAYEGTNKYNFLKDLTEDELETALQIPDLFADGLEAASQKIADFKADPNNKIDKVFDITNYQDDLETVYGNIDKLQTAIGKIDEGKFDFSGDIKDLIKAFPEYSEEILSASDDTDKLRGVLQGLLNSQPNDLIKSLQELRGQLVTDKERKAVDNLIDSLRKSTNAATSVYALSDALDDVSNKQSLLSTVWKEMKSDGQISVSTYKALIEAGDEYAGIATDNNGVLTVSAEKVKELIKKNYELEIATDKNTVSQLRYNAAMAAAARASQAEIDAINQRADLLVDEIKAKETALELINSFDYTSDDTDSGSSSSSDKPDSVLKFEKELAKRQHEIALGKRKENAEYYDWLLSAAHEAYDGLADYESDLWKYEEEVYEWRKNNEQDLFDQKIENLEKLSDKSLDNNDFEGAREAVNTQKTEIQKRIVELETSGKQDVDDEIKELNDKLKELDNTLNDISSKEYEFNISVKEDKIDNFDKEYELTGDTSIFDKKIEVYNGLISDANNEINRLLDLGYSMESDEIQNLLDEIDSYSDEIAGIWEAQTEVIKDNIDEQIKALDRDIDTTGDTKLYSDKIKVYKDGQQDILDMIEFYRKKGYAEDSQIIKDLRTQWQDYQDSINDTLEAQVIAQVEAYSDLMDEQRELLEQQKTAQDEYYDKQIKALEDKKSVLEEINEEIEKENELEEKRQSIAEAERNLYKNVRLVYMGNGQMVQKAREEDLEAVENAEKELSDTLRQQEIKAIEDQITAINEAKSDYDTIIDKQIAAIDESEKSFEEAMQESIEVRKQLDYDFIASIVGIDKANEYKLNAEKVTDNVKSDETDNSAIANSNKAVAESNEKLIESNNKLAESGKSDSAIKSVSPDDVMQMAYNMFKGKGAFHKDISFDEFQNNALNLMNSSSRFTPKIADDVINGKSAVNLTMNNSHTITQNITVNGAGKSGEELANQIAETCESKITQAFVAYGNEYRNTLNKMLYSNK